jgi:hypothetical protein
MMTTDRLQFPGPPANHARKQKAVNVASKHLHQASCLPVTRGRQRPLVYRSLLRYTSLITGIPALYKKRWGRGTRPASRSKPKYYSSTYSMTYTRCTPHVRSTASSAVTIADWTQPCIRPRCSPAKKILAAPGLESGWGRIAAS